MLADFDHPLAGPDGPAPGGRLALLRLVLTDFRNYERLTLDVGPAPVVLTGANGAGKTNLLEAISYLVPGRGLRGAGLDQAVRRGASAWAVAARREGPDGVVELGTGYTLGEAGRSARIDRAPARGVSELGHHLRALWLTPAMDGLFTGPKAERRRFLDRLVAARDPGHGSRLADFDRAMRQRNRLLEEGRPDAAWLAAVEAQMAPLATAIAAARRDTVVELSALLRARGNGVFPEPALVIEGTLEAELGDRAAVDVEAAYVTRLGQSRRDDAVAGRTLAGPHRSDLAVNHAGHGLPAALASTGEQKGLLIALILAQARLVASVAGGVAPLLLLDEIAAHLDDMRRAALFAEILALGAQAWMSGTDAALFTDIADEAQRFEVVSGTVCPAGEP